MRTRAFRIDCADDENLCIAILSACKVFPKPKLNACECRRTTNNVLIRGNSRRETPRDKANGRDFVARQRRSEAATWSRWCRKMIHRLIGEDPERKVWKKTPEGRTRKR